AGGFCWTRIVSSGGTAEVLHSPLESLFESHAGPEPQLVAGPLDAGLRMTHVTGAGGQELRLRPHAEELGHVLEEIEERVALPARDVDRLPVSLPVRARGQVR